MKNQDIALILDANSMLFRAYYAAKNIAKKYEKQDDYLLVLNSQVFKFINSMCKCLIDDLGKNYKYAVAVFDTVDSKFRQGKFDEYKNNRPPRPDFLVRNDKKIKDFIQNMGYVLMNAPTPYEADDAAATLAQLFSDNDIEVDLVSSDKDLLQMVSEKISVILYKSKGKKEVQNFENFQSLNDGLQPYQIIHKKALAGDMSDNYKGAPGIGDATAIKLLLKYDTIFGIYENINELKPKIKKSLLENKDYVELCLDLAQVRRDLDISTNLDNYLINKREI